MPEIRPSGVIIPEIGDSGQEIYDAESNNFRLFDEVLSAAASPGARLLTLYYRQELANSGWDATQRSTSGLYSKVITLPLANPDNDNSQILYDQVDIEFFGSDGEKVYLKAEKLTDTTYRLYSNAQEAFVAVYIA